MHPTISWEDGAVVMLDQRKLPVREVYLRCRTAPEVARAIKSMVIRGAPAIGVAAAMGIALGMRKSPATGTARFVAEFQKTCDLIAATRPTAVNLFWAVERMKRLVAGAVAAGQSVDEIKTRLEVEARAIEDEDLTSCRAIGAYGAALVPDGARILTHCNAGALATAGYGTALGVVGADRIAANGDFANKIGTYSVAVLAREHGLPFYTAAPFSTVDLDTPDGSLIPIEERPHREVTRVGTTQLTPAGAKVRNPAFDVTPNALVTAIVTDRGVARPPFAESLRVLAGAPGLSAGTAPEAPASPGAGREAAGGRG
jgi:methylthioribose-1-phosphate isomerase